jgi:Domain of unknown function (DUF222)
MTLTELRRAMSEYATRFDPARVVACDASRIVNDAAAIEKMAATVKSLAAGRVAETEIWKRDGDRSAAHQLARTTGTSVVQAKETLVAARRLQDLPTAAAAARRGELSTQQVAVIADAASADPFAEARLLEQSRTASLGELRDECSRTKANICDLEERRRRIHERRHLRTWNDTEGAANLHLRDNPEVVAGIMATIEPIRDELFEAARKEGRREPLEAYAADALAELARSAGNTSGSRNARRRTNVLFRVDLTRLLRNYPVRDEVCEIAGYGPVAASAVRDLHDTEDPFLAAVVTKGEDVVGVAHLGRRPNAYQQSALEWLYPTCAVEGCNSLEFLENDHREDWATTHMTVFELLDRLCTHHHDLKTSEGWGLVNGRGKRSFVPPDNPRHPRNAHSHPPQHEANPRRSGGITYKSRMNEP